MVVPVVYHQKAESLSSGGSLAVSTRQTSVEDMAVIDFEIP